MNELGIMFLFFLPTCVTLMIGWVIWVIESTEPPK